jgi:hypothetical protein
MTLSARRTPWALIVWPASLIGLVFVVWLSGYLYWQIRISRAVGDIQREPSKYFTTPNYRNEDLLQIGSRGFRRLFEEVEGALDRGEEEQAAALYCGIADLVEGAWGGDGHSPERPSLRDRPAAADIRRECRQFNSNWAHFEALYAPRWKWWVGSKRGR